MSTEWKRKSCHVQCQTCGMIYIVPRKIPVEEMFVKANCPNCGVTIGLNLGEDQDDVYLYMNINLDSRMY